jgi:hypothetical protein
VLVGGWGGGGGVIGVREVGGLLDEGGHATASVKGTVHRHGSG